MSRSAAPLSPFERTLTRLMFAGIWTAAALLTLGLALVLLLRDSSTGDVLLRSGLLVLMLTPVLRVALSIAEALRQRDWFWLWTTVAVSIVLTCTVAYSLAVR